MKRMRRFSTTTVLNFVLLLLIAVLMAVTVFMVRDKLMQNTQEMGMSLAKSYAAETDLRLDDYLKSLEMAKKYIDELSEEGADNGALQAWMENYSEKLEELFGSHIVDLYAVIGKEIVAANPWEGDSEYDYGSSGWYRDALASEGEIVFSDVYTDAITGTPVFTISQKLAGAEDVLAMDVYLSNGSVMNIADNVPENYHFIILDSRGELLYSLMNMDTDNEEDKNTVDRYLEDLADGIENGSLFSYDKTLAGPQGLNRGVYYASMDNGWTFIITIPLQDILMGADSPLVIILAVISAGLFLTLTALVIRDLKSRKKISDDSSTIRILSDSFYAIYRVDFEAETYTAIKTSPDLQGKIPVSGEYAQLLNTVKQLVRSETFQEFEQNFSIPSIRQRVAEEIPDYGGDYKRKFGDTYKWVNIRTIFEKNLSPHEVVLCFRDVDIEKKQQLQYTALLEDALSTARQSTKAQTTFFSSMSHDMRTPLNAIIGFSALAQQERGDCRKHQDYLQKIEFSAKQLLNLINDILEMSKLEAGQSSLDNKPFELPAFIDETVAHFHVQAAQQKKNFSLQMEIHDEVVKGDSFKIGQVLNNLLSNAFKYSDAGADIRLEIRQEEYQNHSRFRFIVSDSGIGMSEEFLEHIFEPYARETHFSAKSAVGTGLGMTIVKNLVQQMSGEIHVESRLGEGTTFYVTLPLETNVPHTIQETKEEPAQKAVSLSGRRILVAEDNELNMEITSELLSMNGVEVLQAHNGQEAVQMFTASAPYAIDAILMDMQMPVMDGCEASRAIRALDKPDAASVPIIAVTANAFAEDMDKTAAAGMNGHIPKPIDFALLHETLAELLSDAQ